MKITNAVPPTKKIKKTLVVATVAVLLAAYGILTFMPQNGKKEENFINNGEINLTHNETFIDLPASYADIEKHKEVQNPFMEAGYNQRDPEREHPVSGDGNPELVVKEEPVQAEEKMNAYHQPQRELIVHERPVDYNQTRSVMSFETKRAEDEINDSPIGYGGTSSTSGSQYYEQPGYTPDTANTEKLLASLIDKQSSGSMNSQERYLSKASERKSFDLGERIEGQQSPYTLMAGSIIPSAMITGINSDLPGELTAQVRENVYDTITGRYLLIPQGTRLFGSYDSGVLYGQNRVLFTWDRIQFPDGKTIQIRGMKGTDVGGYSGLDADVDNHYGRLMGAILMSSFMAVGTDELDNGNAFRTQMAEDINRSGQKIVDMQLNVKPTLKVQPGQRFNIMVNKDITLQPYTYKG